MNIDHGGFFPHPILREKDENFDYKLDNHLEFKLECELSGAAEAKDHIFKFKTEVTCDEMRISIDDGDVRAGVLISCNETAFLEIAPVDLGSYNHKVNKDKLIGAVTFQFILYASKPISDWSYMCFQTEFDECAFSLRKGEILGCSEPQRIVVPKRQVNVQSIFDIKAGSAPEAPDYFEVAMEEDDKITIFVGPEIKTMVSKNKHSNMGRNLNLSAFYFPSLIAVLGTLREDGVDKYAGKHWYEILNDTFLNKTNYSLEEWADSQEISCLRAAQMIFNYPYVGIHKEIERIGN